VTSPHSASPPPYRLEDTVARLRELIRAQGEKGDHRLPPETVLRRQLQIGRTTLREALARLETEGLITRRRRVGTTINWGPAALRYPAGGAIFALSDFLRESGIPYEVRELAVRREPADQDIAAAFDCPPGTEVFNVTRLYAIDGMLGAHVQHYLPAEFDGQALRLESFTDAAVTFLEQVAHIPLQDAKSTITAEGASSELAAKLSVPVGTPLLMRYTTLYTRDARVVSLGCFAFRPDVVSLEVTSHGHLRLVR
jgi:GntR family transcriptional regulator